jgi:beta-carotene hydroxylase
MVPPIAELGPDLLRVRVWRRVVSLCAPFALTALFFLCAARGYTMLLTFLTYGSISHDLVHRNLRLPRWLNEALLTAIELIAFRSGHAYRVVHLHHHAHFPAANDLEGAAAAMPWWRALIDGLTLQPRLWLFALRRSGAHRRWVLAEGFAVVTLVAVCAVASRATAVYAFLMIGGSWIFPFITSYIPHDARAADHLHQTRLFRGRVLSVVALEHLYHLEHHLYPQVPHHNWPELARRLDPHFERAGLRPIRLFI